MTHKDILKRTGHFELYSKYPEQFLENQVRKWLSLCLCCNFNVVHLVLLPVQELGKLHNKF